MNRTAGRKNVTRLALVGVLALVGGKAAFDAMFQPMRAAPPGYASVAPQGDWHELAWANLYRGKWEQGHKPVLPDAVAAEVGKPVKLKGFLLPLHDAAESSEFFLAKSPGGCYFCNPPGVAEVVMVSIHGNHKLAPTDLPVNVYGKFSAATGGPDDQCLYVVKDATMAVAR